MIVYNSTEVFTIGYVRESLKSGFGWRYLKASSVLPGEEIQVVGSCGLKIKGINVDWFVNLLCNTRFIQTQGNKNQAQGIFYLVIHLINLLLKPELVPTLFLLSHHTK